MEGSAPSRIRSLDLIRGIAVLGILAINVASFAAPDSAAYSPDLPSPGSMADTWVYASNLVFLEGKMRALFSILFGASLLLYVERRTSAGEDGIAVQVRRLLWLGLIGLLHFALLWDGDILFLYACVGLGALTMHRARPLTLAVVALITFTAWQAWGAATWMPSVLREAKVSAAAASAPEVALHRGIIADYRRDDRADAERTLSHYCAEVAARLRERGTYPLTLLAYNWGETLCYILLGMALLKSGFFYGAWSRQRVLMLAGAGLLPGLLITLAFTGWAMPHQFPELAMRLAISYGLAFPHLLMALGYAALLVLLAPRVLNHRLGKRIEAAGKVALSNYLGSTVMMCAVFSGWGVGLFGRFGTAERWLFVLLAWGLMLAWSHPWLSQFKQGPMEWLWRSLTRWRIEPLWRSAIADR